MSLLFTENDYKEAYNILENIMVIEWQILVKNDLKNEFKSGLSNIIPSLYTSNWKAVLAYYEKAEGIRDLFSIENQFSSHAIKIKTARLLLLVSKYFEANNSDAETLYKWFNEVKDEDKMQKIEILSKSVKILKLIFRTYNIIKS